MKASGETSGSGHCQLVRWRAASSLSDCFGTAGGAQAGESEEEVGGNAAGRADGLLPVWLQVAI